MKRSGVLTRETVNGIRRVMRKLGYHGSSVDVWHLVDTVDAQRLVIERLLAGWSVPMSAADELLGWWWHPTRDLQEMSQAEQLAVYDRVVRPDALSWPLEEA